LSRLPAASRTGGAHRGGQRRRHVVDAERLCAPGSVTVSATSWPLVSSHCTGRTLPNGLVELLEVKRPATAPADLPPPTIDESRLRPFVPPAVLDRLLTPRAEWLAEFRRVSVLLAELPGLGDASPASLDRTHEAIRAFQEVVRRFEGTAKVDFDDGASDPRRVRRAAARARRRCRTGRPRRDRAGKALARLGVPCGIKRRDRPRILAPSAPTFVGYIVRAT
jgi:hypothetical protein